VRGDVYRDLHARGRRRARAWTAFDAESTRGVQRRLQKQAVLPQRVHGNMQHHNQRKQGKVRERDATPI
jgi:hypothetical protein